MKKQLQHFILPSLFFASIAVCAQPALTATGINPVIGTSFTYMTPSHFNEGSSGANKIWDFSSLTGSSGTANAFVAVSSTPNGSNFPNATIAINNSGNYAYHKVTSGAYQNYGNVTAAGVVMSFSNPEDFLRFPFTFNNTFTDTWATTYVSGTYTWYRKGTSQVTADGYGTLKLPSGTCYNTLRIHLIQNYTDSTFGTGNPVVYTYFNDEYMWYANGFSAALAGTYNLVVQGIPFTSGAFYLTSTVGVDDISNFINTYDLYPNPASDKITLDFTLTENKDIEVNIFNSLGEKLDISKRENGMQGLNTIQLDVTTLPKGIYFAQILLEGNISQTKRFVVSK